MNIKLYCAAVVAAAFVLPSSVLAAPVRWSGNGHFYQYVLSDASFTDSLAAAAALAPISGATPHLATITSAGENAFVVTLMNGVARAALAGSDAAQEGVWRWIAGPETGQIFFGPGVAPDVYANWGVNEPNDAGGVEDVLEILPGSAGVWNDNLATLSPGAFIVEWSVVSEPTTPALMLFALGLAAVVARRRHG